MADIENEWNINTDIYDIVESIGNLKKNYIQDQDENTLALGIFGFITDNEAKKIQSSIIMTGELGNEMFPQRANLTKNVLAHALFNNITDINAVPATIMLTVGIKKEDFEKYMINGTLTIDHENPVAVQNPEDNSLYEFMFDYDIIINRFVDSNGNTIYSARYDMTEINKVSNITEPYLPQPFESIYENSMYIILQTEARQYSITTIEDKLLSNSIIENKTYSFEFDDQFVDMDIVITDNDLGTVTNVTPLLYGSRSEGIENYCWYMFINDYTIRIVFDHKSYIPGLNCDMKITVYTTLGKDGEFKILRADGASKILFFDITSKRLNYNKITTYALAVSDSENASDRKTKEELQRLIPKAALSRGSISTETDLDNYFNLINTNENRLFAKKKVDNNLSRIWYTYFLMKDINKNIIPTNTIDLRLNTATSFFYLCEDGRYVLPAGTVIKYDLEKDYGVPIPDTSRYLPDPYDDDAYFNEYYYYRTVYNIIINPDPLYCSFYLSIFDRFNYLKYLYMNSNLPVQFISTSYNFNRNLLSDNSLYKLKFSLTQSVDQDFGLYIVEKYEEEDSVTDEVYEATRITNNMKAIVVLMNDDDNPYRWAESDLIDYNKKTFTSYWEADFETDNALDDSNRIKIESKEDHKIYIAGTHTENYGYFSQTTKAYLYFIAKFPDIDYGIGELEDICPGCFPGYTLVNKYEFNNELTFYESFTNVLDSKIKPIELESGVDYTVSSVPVVGAHYLLDEESAIYLSDSIMDKKDYINYCLKIFENSIGIDYKYFNTYGPSKTYYIGDKKKTKIGHLDLEMKFRASIKSSTDVEIKDEIIAYIKDYIEDLYNTGDLHIPNLITELTEKFSQRINYIEFMNFNDFWLGVQHIVKFHESELENYSFIVPEFLNIRNEHDINGDLVPRIEVELIYE